MVVPHLKPGVAAVLLTQSIAAVGTMAIMPTLPFFAMHLHASALEVSLLSSCYNFSQFIFAPIIGALSDRLSRKWVMLGGLLCQAFCNCVQAEADSPASLLLARAMIGVAVSTGPVEMAYIMDFTHDEHQLGQVLALQRVVTNTGALIGPLVAHCFERVGFPALCRGLACINLLCLTLGTFLWESKSPRVEKSGDLVITQNESASSSSAVTAHAAESAPSSLLDNYAKILENGMLCYLLIVSFSFTFSCGVSDGPEPLFFKERFFFGQNQFGYFFMVANASTLVWSPLVPALIAHFGARNACAAGCLGNAVAVVGLIALQGMSWVPYFYAAATVGLFGSMAGLGFMGLLNKSCPKNLLGTVLGLQSSLNGMAGTAAPAVGGLLYYIGRLLPYAATATVSSIVACLYISMPPSANTKDMSELKLLRVSKQKMDGRPSFAGLRRIPSAGLKGMTLYAGKNFTSQNFLNQLTLVMDPKLKDLYSRTLDKIEKEKGLAGGMRPSATVGTGLCAQEAVRTLEHARTMSEAKRGASHDRLAPQNFDSLDEMDP